MGDRVGVALTSVDGTAEAIQDHSARRGMLRRLLPIAHTHTEGLYVLLLHTIAVLYPLTCLIHTTSFMRMREVNPRAFFTCPSVLI
jgi:hypothetical protein